MTPPRAHAPAFALALITASAVVQADPLVDVIDRAAARVTLDGVPREWSGALAALDTRAQVIDGIGAWQGPDDASLGFAVGRDNEGLWIAAEVRDDRVVRSRAHRPADDTVVLTVAFPRGRLWTAWEIGLQPGEPGTFPGAVRYRVPSSRAVPGAVIVEAPSRGGYTFEARIPWAAMPGLRENLASARIRVAYEDSDVEARPSTETVLANGPGDARRPQELPPTVTSAPAVAAAAVDLFARFRSEHHVDASVRPLLERQVNLAGDAAPERLAALPHHLVVWGPGIAGGASYAFLSFDGATVERAEVLTPPRARTALVGVTVRAPGAPLERSVYQVFRVGDDGGFQRVFAHEIGRRDGANEVRNTVAFTAGRLTITVGPSQGFTAQTWPAATEDGVDAPLTPWGGVRARSFVWDASAQSFGPAENVAMPMPAGVSAPSAPTQEPPREPVEPGADVAGVLRLFAEREHLAAGARPEFRVNADVAEDATREQLYVYGRTLVVVGTGFMGGRSYASISLPANPGDTVVGLRAADVTRDGKAEAVVTVRRSVTLQVQGQANTSLRDMAFVYSFDPAHRGRLFAVEVARRVGDEAVVNELVLPEGAQGDTITVQSRPARGWTQSTYPFHDAPPQGFEALLLPWEPTRRVSWRWNGTGFGRVP